MNIKKIKSDMKKIYPESMSIILYGSAIYKKNPNDIDILIIDNTIENQQLQEGNYDILILSVKNFKQNILENNPLFQSILFNFKILKDNKNIFKSNMRRYYYFLKNNPNNIYNIQIKQQKWKIKKNLNRLQLYF